MGHTTRVHHTQTHTHATHTHTHTHMGGAHRVHTCLLHTGTSWLRTDFTRNPSSTWRKSSSFPHSNTRWVPHREDSLSAGVSEVEPAKEGWGEHQRKWLSVMSAPRKRSGAKDSGRRSWLDPVSITRDQESLIRVGREGHTCSILIRVTRMATKRQKSPRETPTGTSGEEPWRGLPSRRGSCAPPPPHPLNNSQKGSVPRHPGSQHPRSMFFMSWTRLSKFYTHDSHKKHKYPQDTSVNTAWKLTKQFQIKASRSALCEQGVDPGGKFFGPRRPAPLDSE